MNGARAVVVTALLALGLVAYPHQVAAQTFLLAAEVVLRGMAV